MSMNSKLSEKTRELWRHRFLEAGIEIVDLDYWNTIACAPMKVHPRLKGKLGLDAPTVLDQVCREPVFLAQGIVGHQPPPHSTSALDDAFLQHCMEMDPSNECPCGMLQDLKGLVETGSITRDEYRAAVTREFLKVTAAKFGGRAPSDEDHEDMEEVVRREQQWMFFFPDAEKFLLALRGKMPMTVISNMWYATEEIFATRTINDIPLKDFFAAIITSFKTHYRKPKPQIFLKAQELTGVPLIKRIMVGDSIRNDAEASLDAGYRFAVVIHRDGELTDEQMLALPDDVLVVEDLMHLYEILPIRRY